MCIKGFDYTHDRAAGVRTRPVSLGPCYSGNIFDRLEKIWLFEIIPGCRNSGKFGITRQQMILAKLANSSTNRIWQASHGGQSWSALSRDEG